MSEKSHFRRHNILERYSRQAEQRYEKKSVKERLTDYRDLYEDTCIVKNQPLNTMSIFKIRWSTHFKKILIMASF